MATQQRSPPNTSAPSSSIKNTYLLTYNFVSAILWLTILGRVVVLAPTAGSTGVWRSTSDFAKWTQTLAIIEVINAALGIVRAPLLTTLMQVASRYLLVWIIAVFFPSSTSTSPAYSSMLLAWSVTEVVRYSYFTFFLGGGINAVPKILQWLRYNTFFVLYPLGISSECWLVFRATESASEQFGSWALYALYAILGIYVPGSYILYSHMMAQRRRVIRGKQRARD